MVVFFPFDGWVRYEVPTGRKLGRFFLAVVSPEREREREEKTTSGTSSWNLYDCMSSCWVSGAQVRQTSMFDLEARFILLDLKSSRVGVDLLWIGN